MRSNVPPAASCECPAKTTVNRPASPPVSRNVLPRTAMKSRLSRARGRRYSPIIRKLRRLLGVHASSQHQRNTDACRTASALQFGRAVEAIQPPLRTMCDSRDSRVNRALSISDCLLLHRSTEPMRNRSGHERWQPSNGKLSFVGIATTPA